MQTTDSQTQKVPEFDLPQPVAATVERALRAGGKLHGFRSGGGLRVLNIDGSIPGYGEHPNVADAFRILSDDILAGRRDYRDVYGQIEPHYLTGSSGAADTLDAWLLRGLTLDAACSLGNVMLVELRGYGNHETPQEIVQDAMRGRSTRWIDSRGITWEASPCRFPNGDAGCQTRPVGLPERMSYHRASMWRTVQTGMETTLVKAVRAALHAEPEEVPDHGGAHQEKPTVQP